MVFFTSSYASSIKTLLTRSFLGGVAPFFAGPSLPGLATVSVLWHTSGKPSTWFPLGGQSISPLLSLSSLFALVSSLFSSISSLFWHFSLLSSLFSLLSSLFSLRSSLFSLLFSLFSLLLFFLLDIVFFSSSLLPFFS